MDEKINFSGEYIFSGINIETGQKIFEKKGNVICQGFYDQVFSLLDYGVQAPDAAVLNLTHLAIGDGTTPATRADTKLESEIFRKALSYKGADDSTFIAKLNIAASEGNPTGGNITEVGIFANADDTTDNGTLISRAVVSKPKNSSIQLTISWRFKTL